MRGEEVLAVGTGAYSNILLSMNDLQVCIDYDNLSRS